MASGRGVIHVLAVGTWTHARRPGRQASRELPEFESATAATSIGSTVSFHHPSCGEVRTTGEAIMRRRVGVVMWQRCSAEPNDAWGP